MASSHRKLSNRFYWSRRFDDGAAVCYTEKRIVPFSVENSIKSNIINYKKFLDQGKVEWFDIQNLGINLGMDFFSREKQ